MSIIAKFDIDEIFAPVYAKVDDITDAVIEAIKAACTQTVANARKLNTYKDRTTVLRSSIGFVIYDHGQKVTEDFRPGAGAIAPEGVRQGQELAEMSAKEYPDSIVAVVVAGAHYAVYVESRGYDVITGPCSELNSILAQYLKEALASFQ